MIVNIRDTRTQDVKNQIEIEFEYVFFFWMSVEISTNDVYDTNKQIGERTEGNVQRRETEGKKTIYVNSSDIYGKINNDR